MNAWQELQGWLDRFPSVVLTGHDADGRPVSLRCRPERDTAAEALRITAPSWLDVRPGPASLMGHSHDEALWSLAGFALRGILDRDGATLVFRPTRFAARTGSSLVGLVGVLRSAHRASRAYLRRRGQPVPQVPWDTIAAAKARLPGAPTDRRDGHAGT